MNFVVSCHFNAAWLSTLAPSSNYMLLCKLDRGPVDHAHFLLYILNTPTSWPDQSGSGCYGSRDHSTRSVYRLFLLETRRVWVMINRVAKIKWLLALRSSSCHSLADDSFHTFRSPTTTHHISRNDSQGNIRIHASSVSASRRHLQFFSI